MSNKDINLSMKFKDWICIILIWITAAVSYVPSLTTYGLYVCVPMAFILSFSCGENSIRKSIYVKVFLALIIWICFTYFGAKYVSNANRQMKQVLGSFLLCITVSNLAAKEKFLPWLYCSFLIYFVGMYIYVRNNLWAIVMNYTDSRVGGGDEYFDSNSIAYYLFFVTVAIYMLKDFFRKPIAQKLIEYLFWCTIPLSFFSAIITGSRQVLIIQLPLIVSLLCVRYLYGKSNSKKIIILTLLTTIFVVGIKAVEGIYSQSLLKERYEIGVQDDSRYYLLLDALEVGFNHPLFGVGPGNYVQYSKYNLFSHCTYTELFANCGFLGLFFFCWMLAIFLVRQYKRYRRTNDILYLGFIIFGVFYCFDNFFFVFYIGMWLMAFFFLIAAHSELYYNKQCLANRGMNNIR